METLAPPSHCRRRRPWQDLPSELLGLVLQRVPSHADRVRLRAVCRAWRASARLQPALPALLPWLALRDGSFLSLPDGEVHHRVLVPDDDVAHRVSTGSTLFLVHSNDECSLMNPLSRSRETTASRCVDLNCLCTRPGVLVDTDNIRKVVVMSDHVVAVRAGPRMYLKDVTISIRRPQSTTVEWQWAPPRDTYSSVCDMALFQDKLYVLTVTNYGVYPLRLYAMDMVSDNHVSFQRMITTLEDDVQDWNAGDLDHYLVASGDRLLMVKRMREVVIVLPGPRLVIMPTWFEVFEAADLGRGRGCWRKVSTLMGRALFLSEGCSESLPAGGAQNVGPREDCIYFLNECNRYDARTRSLCSGVYDMRDGTFSPLPFQAAAAREGPLTSTWFFPADT
ncbi:hypothetical protein ACQJBY_021067 [Aegilops geniculata]